MLRVRTCGAPAGADVRRRGPEYVEGLGGRDYSKRPSRRHRPIVCLGPSHGVRDPVALRSERVRGGTTCVRQGAACSVPAFRRLPSPLVPSASRHRRWAGGVLLADRQTLCHRRDAPVGAVPRSHDRRSAGRAGTTWLQVDATSVPELRRPTVRRVDRCGITTVREPALGDLVPDVAVEEAGPAEWAAGISRLQQWSKSSPSPTRRAAWRRPPPCSRWGWPWPQQGRRVLVVDLDPQACLTFSLGFDPDSLDSSLHDVLVRRAPLADVVRQCPRSTGLDLVPATIDLAGAEVHLLSRTGREHVLARRWCRSLSDYDAVLDRLPAFARRADHQRPDRGGGVIDTPPVRGAEPSRRRDNCSRRSRTCANSPTRSCGCSVSSPPCSTPGRRTRARCSSEVEERYGLPMFEPAVPEVGPLRRGARPRVVRVPTRADVTGRARLPDAVDRGLRRDAACLTRRGARGATRRPTRSASVPCSGCPSAEGEPEGVTPLGGTAARRQASALLGRTAATRPRQPVPCVRQPTGGSGCLQRRLRAVRPEVADRAAGPADPPASDRGVAAPRPLRPPHDLPELPPASLVQRDPAADGRSGLIAATSRPAGSLGCSVSSAPGWRVGRRRVRTRAEERHEGQHGQGGAEPVDPARRVVVDDGLGGRRRARRPSPEWRRGRRR